MNDVHPILRKALALTLLTAVGMLLWIGVARPIQQRFFAYDASIDQSVKLLEKYAAVGAEVEQLESQLKVARANRNADGGFINGDSVELAGADMQERIKAIVEDGGGRLKSSQMLAVEEQDSARRLGVRINLAGDVDALQKMLYDFEAAKPYFFIDQLNIQASRWAVQQARRRRARRRGNPAELQIRFDVYAYMRPATE